MPKTTQTPEAKLEAKQAELKAAKESEEKIKEARDRAAETAAKSLAAWRALKPEKDADARVANAAQAAYSKAKVDRRVIEAEVEQLAAEAEAAAVKATQEAKAAEDKAA